MNSKIPLLQTLSGFGNIVEMTIGSCIKKDNILTMTSEELEKKFSSGDLPVYKKRNILILLAVCLILVSVFLVSGIKISRNNTNQLSLALFPESETAVKMDYISIPVGVVKANPFLPYRNIDDGANTALDVPKFDLIAPPETISEGSDAARVMDTIVSGILYDKFSPSAILNIEGNDYLVKKGDVVNNYKVLNITQNDVTVKLGNNTLRPVLAKFLPRVKLLRKIGRASCRERV